MSDYTPEKVLDLIKQSQAEYTAQLQKENKAMLDQHEAAVTDCLKAVDRLEADMKTALVSAADRPGRKIDEGLKAYARTGVVPVMAAATEGVDTAGGYLVPEAVAAEIVQHGFANPIRDLANKVTISGANYAEIESSAAVGSWAAEGATRTGTVPTLVQNSAKAFTEAALLPASEELVEDAAFDIQRWLTEGAAAAFAKLESEAFATGNGTTAPKGILSYERVADAEWTVGKIGTVTAAGSAISADDLIDLQTALDDTYQANATWLMNKATFRSVLKLKAGTSGSNMFLLWQPQVINGALEHTLLGSRLRQWSALPAVASGVVPVVYGDIYAGYTVVDRTGVVVVRQLDVNTGLINFYVRRRVGGVVRNSNAIKALAIG